MRTILIRTVMAVFSLFVLIALFDSGSGTTTIFPSMDAAFRDGLYLGRLDAHSGSKPNPLKARWSSETDRRSFAAGYFQGYMVEGVPSSSAHWVPQPLDNQGFEAGRLDGIADRENARAFDLQSKAKFRNPAFACDEKSATVNSCARQFRDAYITGYQHGYYQVDRKIARRAHGKTGRPQNV